jgi:hypothetical protein
MEINDQLLSTLINASDFNPEQMGAGFWCEAYRKQNQEKQELKARLDGAEKDKQELEAKVCQMEKELEQLKEKLNKLSQRNSENSSLPPSSDGYKKESQGFESKVKKKRGPKYGHEGTTRNGFERIDNKIELNLENCPVCETPLERVESALVRRSQIAELVSQPVQVNEYERPLYRCPNCGWQGYADLPLGCREDFSYGALLSSLVGWLGYGGHLSWAKQRYLVETIFRIPLSRGSLSKMHQWFCESLYPSYEQWWELIQQPGVRCVDETSYRLSGINYWLWVATSDQACVLFLAPTRSSAEVKSLLGEDFNGILSSDCWSAYGPVGAEAKQKCLAHIERELKALETAHLKANRQFAQQVFPILHSARQAHRNFHSGQLSRERLAEHRVSVEAQLAEVLSHPPVGGWATDSQNLANRFRKHWSDWFTFLTYPEVKPDNNDAERALRPVVVHRKVSGGARSHWGGQLVAMIFSFLETMRLQGKNAVEELFKLLVGGRYPPQTDFVLSI